MDITFSTIILYGTSLGFLLLLLLCAVLFLITTPYAVIVRYKAEQLFFDPNLNKYFPFPSIDETPSINLSVIIPAYNEETRLPPMLDECLSFLGTRESSFKYELIIVSDGSTDKTVDIGYKYSKQFGSDVVRVLKLIKNRGKGGAVRLGMMSARGSMLLFADADGATKFSDICKLEDSLKDILRDDYIQNPHNVFSKQAIAIGSRSHLEEQAIVTRSYFRTFLMYGFHALVWFFAVQDVKDTQCGFKLMTRQSARLCFKTMHVERWAFDVELLYIAQQLKIPISEISVNWTEIDGSKVTPVLSWIQMGCDLILIWLRYKIGAWKLYDSKSS